MTETPADPATFPPDIALSIPIRVAMLIPTIDRIGGAERQVLLLAKELTTLGYEVTVIALSGSVTHPVHLDDSVHYLSLRMRHSWIDPRGWHIFRAWAVQQRPAILHAHLPHAIWFARAVRLLNRLRLLKPFPVLIDTIHTSATGPLTRRLGYRLTNFLTDQVTCVSDAVAQAALASRMVHPGKLTILPNGVPLSPVPDRLPLTQRVPDCFHWVAVGRLAPVKDYPTLLRAFAALPSTPCPPTLLIAGEGPDEIPLRALAAELHIADRVLFAGFRDDIQPILATADAFVLTSLWEGLPLSVLEAQAAALPVVATNVPGTAEALIPDFAPAQTGLLVPPQDIPALTAAMAQIMALSDSARHKMGSQARAHIEQNFSIAAIAARWHTLYQSLLTQQRHPNRR